MKPMTQEQKKMFNDNINLVYYIINKMNIPEVYMNDCIQTGYLALMTATQSFNSNTAKFDTYACNYIKFYIYNFFHKMYPSFDIDCDVSLKILGDRSKMNNSELSAKHGVSKDFVRRLLITKFKKSKSLDEMLYESDINDADMPASFMDFNYKTQINSIECDIMLKEFYKYMTCKDKPILRNNEKYLNAYIKYLKLIMIGHDCTYKDIAIEYNFSRYVYHAFDILTEYFIDWYKQYA